MANSENYVWNPATRLVQRDLFFIYRNDQITGNRTELQSDTRFAASTALRIVGGLDWSNNQLERGTRGAGALPGAVFNVQPVNPNLGNTPLQFERRVPQADANIVTVAPFMEALFEPIKQVKIIGGLRHDRIDIDRRDRITQSNSTSKSYSPTTRRLGLVWSVTNTTNLYAGYATSADPVQQFVSLSSAQSDLSLQRGKQAEVGLKQSTADGRFDWTAAVYSIRETDLVQTVTWHRASRRLKRSVSNAPKASSWLRHGGRSRRCAWI